MSDLNIIGSDPGKVTLTKECDCGVPTNLHTTCCGWINAITVTDIQGTIMEKRHPGFLRNYNEWRNEQYLTSTIDSRCRAIIKE